MLVSLFSCQDFMEDARKIISCMTVCSLLHNEADKEPEYKISCTRKVGHFLSKTFGMSTKDLAPSIQSRFEEFGKNLELNALWDMI